MSALPIFFHEELPSAINAELELQQDTAKHVVQVLRMQQGDRIALTDGKGKSIEAVVAVAHKKKCTVSVVDITTHIRNEPLLHIVVAFTKNSNRNEWILEKVTELGVATITPLSATRSEREKFRFDRWQNILVSAILQSQQYYLPDLKPLSTIDDVVDMYADVPQKLMAHCMESLPRQPILQQLAKDKETLLLIGPEGDFTEEEVKNLTSKGYKGITMGSNRLRTETAAVTAAAVFNMVNNG